MRKIGVLRNVFDSGSTNRELDGRRAEKGWEDGGKALDWSNGKSTPGRGKPVAE
jgi:hypothetical protein